MAVPKEKKPVVTAHLRLDAALAEKLPKMSGRRFGWSLVDDKQGVINKDKDEQSADNNAERKRIKAINAYLGSSENALAIAKLRGSPMALLIERASAKGEELMAAQEIELAYFAISGALMIRPLNMERVGRGRFPDWSARTSQAVQQYQSWANYWSIRKKAHLDHTLECVIAAVIDQRPIRVIAEDLGFQHKRIERAVLGGLRDYAARAGWVDGKIAQRWMEAAEQTFRRGVAV